MAYYANPAHAYAPSRAGPSYATSHGRPAPNPANRRRVPQDAYTPKQGWKAATGRPQMHAPVSFDYPGRAREGVSMRELRLKGESAPIHGANDLVFAHTGLQRLVFRILWPGYGHVEWCRAMPVVASNGAPITRVALGVQIASNFSRFFEKTQYETPKSTDWMVSPTCVRFEHLVLVSLQNTFEDVWQADVILDFSS